MAREAVVYQFDGVEVRPASFAAIKGRKELPLEPKAFRLLLYLIENRDRAVGKSELIETVWQGAAVTDNALTRAVAQLRRELGDDARQPRYIQTLPTLGYRFAAHVQVVHAGHPPVAPRQARRWLAAGILLLLCVAGLSWLLARSGEAARSLPPAFQVTTSLGVDSGATFSPDGRFLAYSSNRSKKFEIYRRPIDLDGRDQALTSDGMQNLEPAWSPDGKRIVYRSVARGGIWIIPSTGGEPRRLSAFGSVPKWSPDGKQIVFRSAEPHSLALFDIVGLGDSTIWTVAADGSALRQVTNRNHPPGQHASPAWSPDGSEIAFAALGSDRGIWTVQVQSGELRRIQTGKLTWQLNPVFSADGKGIYFTGLSTMQAFQIFYVALPGGEPLEIYPVSQNLPIELAISSDGKRMAYTSGLNTSQIWVARAAKPEMRPLFRQSVIRAKLPMYSPDGSRIAFIVQKAGRNSQDLWVMNADGSDAAAVAAEPGLEEAPTWSADGSAIFYTYFDGSRPQVKKVLLKDGSRTVLIPDASPYIRPLVMPDETELLYESGTPSNIWRMPLRGSPPRQLTFARENATFPRVSPDGQWIAYQLARGETTQVALMDRNGGNQQVLTDSPGRSWSGGWASDNRRFSYTWFHDGVWNLWWMDRVTHERKQITEATTFGPFSRTPDWRPGSDEIAHEWSEAKSNIFLLDLDR